MPRPRRLRRWDDSFILPIVILPLFVFVCYANSLYGEFIFDDIPSIMDNFNITNTDQFREIFYWNTSRPLLDMSFRANYYFGGLNTFGYHLVNVILHCINSILVAVILLRVVKHRIAAMVGAIIFACHPLLTSSVASISGRSSLLCATFYFIAILLVMRREYALAVIAWVLAMGAKEEAAALPLFAMFWMWRTGVFKPKHLVGFALAGILVFGLNYKSVRSVYEESMKNTPLNIVGLAQPLNPSDYVHTYWANLAPDFLLKMAVPFGLNGDPDLTVVKTWNNWRFIPIVLILCASGLAFWFGYYPIPVGLAALWLSPMLLYSIFPLADPIMENRAYIPMLGVAILATELHSKLTDKWIAIIFLCLCVITISRNRVWHTPQTFWEDTVYKSPFKDRPRVNLAMWYQTHGMEEDAVTQYRLALVYNPNLWIATSNLSSILIKRQDYAEAEILLLNTLQGSPKFEEAWINLGVLCLNTGRLDDALYSMNRALEINPLSSMAKYNKDIVVREILERDKKTP